MSELDPYGPKQLMHVPIVPGRDDLLKFNDMEDTPENREAYRRQRDRAPLYAFPFSGDPGARITFDFKDCGCITGAYNDVAPRCGPECGSTYEAHHIVADYTLRYGSRTQAIAGEGRIPGLPTFDEGPSICLNGKAADRGSEHGLAHQADRKVYLLGSNSRIPGTAPISSITEIYAGAASAATQGRCTFEINKAVSAQPSLNSNILGRTTQGPPDLESDVYSKLQSGTREIMQ